MRPVYWEIPPKREWLDGKVTIVAKKSRQVIATLQPRTTALEDGRHMVSMNNGRVKAHLLALDKQRNQQKASHAQTT